MALIATQKKTHGASYVAVRLLGFPRPAADFATAEKLYPQMPEKGKPEKGTFCRTGIIAYFHERRSLNNFHRDRVITFEQIAE
ncbi:hypothetical protein V6217_26030 [Escherichia coli]|uniref:hypothetical protein n=1 Tax=Escherichia coli TaxID=562 RepID=UPI003700947A